ncbi:MAG: PBP1A family penicillin-binding protein, partial [Holosporales bacterium]|nr:PBP1A family penicillin-binding protein [Holosporales bacterium]
MKSLFRFLSVVFFVLFSVAGIVGIGGLGFLYYFARGLPDHHELETYAPPLTSRVFSSDGRLVAEYATERRSFVPVEAVPEHLVHAFLAAEDKNFFKHPGLDPLGILRAVFVNFSRIKQHKRPTGASTITQQVAKNFLLGSEISYRRKIREAILAFRIEQALGKKRILELYLNKIYLGMGSYGVAGAAYAYFGKSLGDLSIAECAYLAALAKGAENYHPVRHPFQAKERRDWVIKRMQEEGWVSPQEAEKSRGEPIEVVPLRERPFVRADYFAEEIRRELIEKFSSEKLYSGGFIVQSTLVPALQEAAEETLRSGLRAYDRTQGWRGPLAEDMRSSSWKALTEQYEGLKGDLPLEMARVQDVRAQDVLIELKGGRKGRILLAELTWARKKQGHELGSIVKRPRDVLAIGQLIWVSGGPKDYVLEQIPEVQGALVALDPRTGHVWALQGGYTFNASQYNRATQAKRQSGSAIKPFVYLAGLIQGLTPITLFEDAPIAIDLGIQGIWRPRNFGKNFLGTVPMRVGLEKSLNTLTVRVAQKTGIEKIAEITEAFGIFEKMPRQLSMALGAGETTLLRLTTAYGMLINGGRKITPSLISFVQDRYGKVVLKNDHRVSNAVHNDATESESDKAPPILPDTRPGVADPRSVYQIVSMLEGAVARGTARKAKELGVPVLAKTGTSNDSRDVWCLGGTPNIVVGVFIGADTPQCLGKHATGGTLAAPV